MQLIKPVFYSVGVSGDRAFGSNLASRGNARTCPIDGTDLTFDSCAEENKGEP